MNKQRLYMLKWNCFLYCSLFFDLGDPMYAKLYKQAYDEYMRELQW